MALNLKGRQHLEVGFLHQLNSFGLAYQISLEFVQWPPLLQNNNKLMKRLAKEGESKRGKNGVLGVFSEKEPENRCSVKAELPHVKREKKGRIKQSSA